MSAQDLEPVAWITPESIRHLAKMNGPANVVVWNCASGNARVPLYAAPQQPAPVVDDAMRENAARYEWLKKKGKFAAEGLAMRAPERWDEAIDHARAQVVQS